MLIRGEKMDGFFGKPKKEWIQARCVIADLFTVGDDEWPSEFRIEPRMGEFVESTTGRRLKIIRVTHKFEDYRPLIELELGKDMTSVTPTEGGTPSVSMEPE
jgi:hypothetical protein